jgi:hypothetical protein
LLATKKAISTKFLDKFKAWKTGEISERWRKAALDEAGYLWVAKLGSDEQMEKYMRRLLDNLNLEVRDENAFRGIVPHFSGTRTLQTFFALEQEILSTAALEGSWLHEKLHRKTAVLLQERSISGRTAPLNERGYQSVATLKNNDAMKEFVRRAVADLGFHVANSGGLAGIVPFYSGERSTQSFAKLRADLVSAVRSRQPWVASGKAVMLNQIGFDSVRSLRVRGEMTNFIRRVAHHHGCATVRNEDLAMNVASFAQLEAKLRQACGLDELRFLGSIHDVVGADGVLQISMGTSARETYSAKQLQAAGIVPTSFAATDAYKTPQSILRQSCPLAADVGTKATCKTHEKALGFNFNVGQPGCKSKVEQAITDSHRQALMAALKRNGSDWTAIIEDDVVPLHTGLFDAAFQKAWARVPEWAKLVRLGWCTFEKDLGSIRKATFADAGHFRLVRDMSWADGAGKSHYYTGGCTTGYIVHRSLVPELLGMFPCCCPIDCCMERQLFYKPAKRDVSQTEFRGQQIMINMDAWDSKEDSINYTNFNQGGVFVQDNRDLRTSRPDWNESE